MKMFSLKTKSPDELNPPRLFVDREFPILKMNYEVAITQSQMTKL